MMHEMKCKKVVWDKEIKMCERGGKGWGRVREELGVDEEEVKEEEKSDNI